MRKIVCFLLVICLGLATGCMPHPDVRVDVNGNKTVGVRTGQLLYLSFEANPTTGYLWELEEGQDHEILKRIGKFRYVHSSRRIGDGGVQVFRFEALKKGKLDMSFKYARPWEKDVKPVKEYTVRVFVN